MEWARIEPEPGEFSEAALAYYRTIWLAYRELGITPIVTLHHFTNPQWVAEQGGWLSPKTVDDFARFAGMMGREFGGLQLVFVRDEPQLGQYTFKQPDGGLVSLDYDKVEEIDRG